MSNIESYANNPGVYWYLASPYSHPCETVQEAREIAASKVAARLTQGGRNLFCPITQSHRLNQFLEKDEQLKHEECMRVDYSFLSKAEGLFVVMLPGYEHSIGVKLEVDYAREHNMPVIYLNPDRIIKEDVVGDVGVKDSVGKTTVRLVPYAALKAIAGVRDFGNKKYRDPAKWYEFDDKQDEFIEAAMRHIAKHHDAVLYKNRSVNDDESGLPHLDHAITSLALAIALRDKPKEGDK